jgi:hypothetical protein
MGAKLNTKAGTYEASPGAGTYNPPTKVRDIYSVCVTALIH